LETWGEAAVRLSGQQRRERLGWGQLHGHNGSPVR
jgi:hypothetical protein